MTAVRSMMARSFLNNEAGVVCDVNTSRVQGVSLRIPIGKKTGEDGSSSRQFACPSLDRRDRSTAMITFKRPDGKDCSAFYAEAGAGNRAPGVVVIQEWWGLNDQIKGVANRLAAAGYRALVPDLYRGKVGLDAKEAEHLMTNLNFGDAATQDIRGAVQYLKQTSPRVGVTGFCMGGALTILAAVHVPEADAAVAWYGCPPLDYVDAAKIKIPLMGHWAIDDPYFPIKQIEDLEEKLKKANVRYEFYRYKAVHAFANETLTQPGGPGLYNPEAAEQAWHRTMAFLKQYLGEPSSTRAGS
jgi:carboxymethylenebutenolidase